MIWFDIFHIHISSCLFTIYQNIQHAISKWGEKCIIIFYQPNVFFWVTVYQFCIFVMFSQKNCFTVWSWFLGVRTSYISATSSKSLVVKVQISFLLHYISISRPLSLPLDMLEIYHGNIFRCGSFFFHPKFMVRSINLSIKFT